MARSRRRAGRGREGVAARDLPRGPAASAVAAPSRPPATAGSSVAAQGAGLLISNKWIRGSERSSVVSPWTGKPVATVEQAGRRELDQALDAARSAFGAWAGSPRHRRASLLASTSGLLARDREKLAAMIAHEAGKPLRFARAEVDRAVRTFVIAAEELRQDTGGVLPVDAEPGGEGYTARIERFPVGVVAAISPFNFPLNLVAHKVAPALAAGNCVVVKPPPQAPSAALHLGRLLVEAGAPPGVIAVLPCPVDVAEQLALDPRVSLLSFTGSAGVGWRLRGLAARKACVLELGGNAAAIVHGDSDLEWVAERLALGAYLYAGQVCISVQRILVERACLRRFQRLFAHAAEDLPAGDPMDANTVVGPMIDSRAADRVEEWMAQAVRGGARRLTGGVRSGPLITPAVLDDVPGSAKVWREEVFGPVAVLAPYDDFEVALAQVNDSDYGLQAAVFTHDERRIEAAFRGLEVGAVVVNDYPTLRFDHLPYGGVKASGMGREGLRYAMREMSQPRLLLSRIGPVPKAVAAPGREPVTRDEPVDEAMEEEIAPREPSKAQAPGPAATPRRRGHRGGARRGGRRGSPGGKA